MSADKQYHVYITGNTVGNIALESARESFATKFKLSADNANKVFDSPMPLYVKKGIDEKTANAYKQAIVAMGLEALVEPKNQPKATQPAEMSLVSKEEQDTVPAPTTGESKSYATVVEMKKESAEGLEILYETPESALSDEGESIGGWLRFYQVINIISVVLGGVVLLGLTALLLIDGVEGQEAIELLVLLAEMVPALIVVLLTARAVSVQDEGTPMLLMNYLHIGLAISFLGFIAGLGLFYGDITSEKPTSILGSIIYYYIWTSYFKKSVRVREYYGVNAT